MVAFLNIFTFFTICTTGPPIFQSVPKTRVSVITNVVMNCKTVGHPKPVVTWSRPFQSLPSRAVVYNNGTMVLSKFKLLDSGPYVCKAKNRFGEVQHVTHLYLGKAKPTVSTVQSVKTFNVSGKWDKGTIQQYKIPKSGKYKIRAAGARGGTHKYNYGYKPGTYYGGKGATMEGIFQLSAGTSINIVVGQRGGNSVEVKGGRATTKTAAELGTSVEDNAGTGGGGGSFVYTSDNNLLIAAGGGGGSSAGYNGVDGQNTTSGTKSRGRDSSKSKDGGTNGNAGVCNTGNANYHGGIGAGWNGQGCSRKGHQHGGPGGSRAQGWVGGQAGGMNSGKNGGPAPGAVGGFGGGGGGSEDNGASGGGGGYSGGGSGIYEGQGGGGGGSFCSGIGCSGITGGNSNDSGFVQFIYYG